MRRCGIGNFLRLCFVRAAEVAAEFGARLDAQLAIDAGQAHVAQTARQRELGARCLLVDWRGRVRSRRTDCRPRLRGFARSPDGRTADAAAPKPPRGGAEPSTGSAEFD